ncbi:hypothetical protein BH11PSE12_BH11PSE12_32900 [soil metagenome]
MRRYLFSLMLLGLASASSAQAADNRIGGVMLASTTVAKGTAFKVYVTGTGSCLTRVETGGAQMTRGVSYVDLPGAFPKFVSLTAQGAAGSYTILAQNANSRDAPCLGSATATLIITDTAPQRTATPAATTTTTLAPTPLRLATTTTTTTAAAESMRAAVIATTTTTSVASESLRVAAFTATTTSMGRTTTTTLPAWSARSTDPCTLSAREQEALGVTCNTSLSTGSGADRRMAGSGADTVRDATGAETSRTSNERAAADAIKPAGGAKSGAPKKKTEMYEPGQLVILWDEIMEGLLGLNIMARDYGLQPSQRNELSNLGGMLATFQFRDNKQAIALRTTLRQKYPHWHVDLHARYQSLEGARIYAPTKIDAPVSITPLPNLRVGILDTAVTSIPALQTAKLTQRNFLAVKDMPASPVHGTAIAAPLSGHDKANNFQGLAVGAQLFVGAIMRDQGGQSSSNTATLLLGLDWLIGNKVQVINLSLGGSGDDLMASIFAKLQKRGIIIVASAGNGGPDAPPSYPAAYRGVLAVTAVDALDQAYRDANLGGYIAIAAPGVDVWTPDAVNGHYVSGTSFSAAVVTGAIGLMLSRKADLTADGVRENLCRNARDLGAPGTDPVYGCGLMQVSRTLAALK